MKLSLIYSWLVIVLVVGLPYGIAFSVDDSSDVISEVEINGNLKVEKDAIEFKIIVLFYNKRAKSFFALLFI